MNLDDLVGRKIHIDIATGTTVLIDDPTTQLSTETRQTVYVVMRMDTGGYEYVVGIFSLESAAKREVRRLETDWDCYIVQETLHTHE